MAHYIFVDHDARFAVDLSVVKGIETTKDLYCFCLDLLCKGLVILFGTENRVVVEDLSKDQFQEVNDRLKLLGIECMLDIIRIEEDVPMPERLKRMVSVYNMPDNLPLEDYKLELVSSKAIFQVSFHLFHNTGSKPCPRA